MKRFEALKIILDHLDSELVITTTGMTSRETFGAKDRDKNFYMVGSMGLVTPLSLGIALNCPQKKVVAIEGDGSFLMNLGAQVMVGAEKPKNLLTIVLDNGTYESTGGQKCISQKVDFTVMAKSMKYRNIFQADSEQSLKESLVKVLKLGGPCFLHIKIESSHEEGIPRVSHTPEEIKDRFMKSINL